jgi:hypothetical protein
MGAGSWSYYVPYHADVNKALQDLRQKTFEEGDYYTHWKFLKGAEAKFPGFIKQVTATLTPEERAEFDRSLEKPEEPPQTIEELFEMNGEEGTHSIIDIEGAYLEPLAEGEEGEYGVVYPLPAEDLLEIFETARPTREMIENIEQADGGLIADYVLGSQTGIYVTFYKDDRPDGYFFSGYSGD